MNYGSEENTEGLRSHSVIITGDQRTFIYGREQNEKQMIRGHSKNTIPYRKIKVRIFLKSSCSVKRHCVCCK